MSNRKIVKKTKKGGGTKEHNSPSSSIVLCRLMHFDQVEIPTNQQEGKETGKESIWLNQSIYKCTKVYTVYNEGAVSVSLGFFYRYYQCFFGGEEVFCQRLNWQKLARPLSVRKFHLDCIVFFVVASTTPHGEYGILHGTKTNKKTGQEIHRFHFCYQSKATTTTTHRHLYIVCNKNCKLYHYFEIVYVKVIFLHVDGCYFVF